MYKYAEQMRTMVQLADTGIEALEHLDTVFRNNNAESSLYLINDIVDGFLCIQQAYEGFPDELPDNCINECEAAVENLLYKVMLEVKGGNIKNIGVALGSNLQEKYREWRNELARCFNPYIIN